MPIQGHIWLLFSSEPVDLLLAIVGCIYIFFCTTVLQLLAKNVEIFFLGNLLIVGAMLAILANSQITWIL
jgi:hypothetical protein